MPKHVPASTPASASVPAAAGTPASASSLVSGAGGSTSAAGGSQNHVTLQAIASEAGVAKITVSRALRNQGPIREETKAHILAVADRMGYRQDANLVHLMTHLRNIRQGRKQPTIALLRSSDNSAGEFFSDTRMLFEGETEVAGVHERARELNYSVSEFHVNSDGLSEKRLSDILYSRGICGLIISGFPSPNSSLNLDWHRFTAVALGYTLRSPDLTRIANDHFGMMTQAMNRLWDMGYRRIGVAMGSRADARNSQYPWRAGCLVHYNRLGLELPVPMLIDNDVTVRKLDAWIKEWRPDVIASCGESDKVWTLLQQMKLRIPEDIGFVSLQVKDIKNSIVSGIDHKAREKGRIAVDTLIKQLHANEFGAPLQPTTILTPMRWIEGKTLREQR